MSRRFSRHFLLALPLLPLAVACGGRTSAGPVTDQTPHDASTDSSPKDAAPPDSATDSMFGDSNSSVGPVTFRFVNPTSADLYIEYSIGIPPISISREKLHLTTSTFCTPLCEDNCSCMMCGAALPSVRVVPAHGVFTYVWDGTHYDSGTCSEGCGCNIPRQSPAGLYQIAMSSSTSFEAEGDYGPSSDPNIILGASPSGYDCDASTETSLHAGEQTVSLTFLCPE